MRLCLQVGFSQGFSQVDMSQEHALAAAAEANRGFPNQGGSGGHQGHQGGQGQRGPIGHQPDSSLLSQVCKITSKNKRSSYLLLVVILEIYFDITALISSMFNVLFQGASQYGTQKDDFLSQF